MGLTRRKFLQTAVLGAAAAAIGLGLANIGMGPMVLKKVEAEQESSPWSLQITNLAGNTVTYGYDQLLAMPVTSVAADLDCDGDLVDAGNWSGVSLGYLLQQAGVDPAVAYVGFRARDGYAISIPLSQALSQYVIIAYELDGSPLPEVLRLVLPGESGDLWIDAVTSFTMSTSYVSADQSGSTTVSTTALTSTQQQGPVQPQSQPVEPNNEGSTESVVVPSNATQSAQKTSTTQESRLDGSISPAMAAGGIAVGAAVAMTAAGYLARPRRAGRNERQDS